MVARKKSPELLEEQGKATLGRPADAGLSDCHKFLAIDRDDLDSCLVEQPEVFYRVAQAFAVANSERDSAKLDLEEAQADLGVQFRREAVENDEKITEGAIQQKLHIAPRIQKLERELLRYKADADAWAALKESFIQRSFMLRELVALKITQRHDEGAAGGAISGHAKLAQSNKERTDELRRSKREV